MQKFSLQFANGQNFAASDEIDKKYAAYTPDWHHLSNLLLLITINKLDTYRKNVESCIALNGLKYLPSCHKIDRK